MTNSRVDRHTEKFVNKEVHGKLVRVRILNPFTEEDAEKRKPRTPARKKKPKKKYCKFCETEIFDAGKECDLCGHEF